MRENHKDTKMPNTSRLSLADAMRLGSAVTEPTTPGEGDFFEVSDFTGKICAACAIGAIHVALCGLLKPRSNDVTDGYYPDEDALFAAYPILLEQVNCPSSICAESSFPVIDGGGSSLGNMISHLFERHKWNREEIALWVEGIERARIAPTTTTTEPFPLAPMSEAAYLEMEAREDYADSLYIDGEINPAEDPGGMVEDLLREDAEFWEEVRDA